MLSTDLTLTTLISISVWIAGICPKKVPEFVLNAKLEFVLNILEFVLNVKTGNCPKMKL